MSVSLVGLSVGEAACGHADVPTRISALGTDPPGFTLCIRCVRRLQALEEDYRAGLVSKAVVMDAVEAMASTWDGVGPENALAQADQYVRDLEDW